MKVKGQAPVKSS